MPVDTLDDVARRVSDLMDSDVPSSRIILIEEHPDHPGHLSLEPLDETARGMFYGEYRDWMSFESALAAEMWPPPVCK